jgi:hypothetical protein
LHQSIGLLLHACMADSSVSIVGCLKQFAIVQEVRRFAGQSTRFLGLAYLERCTFTASCTPYLCALLCAV